MTQLFVGFWHCIHREIPTKPAGINKSIAKQKALYWNLNYKRVVSFYCVLWCRQWQPLHDNAFFFVCFLYVCVFNSITLTFICAVPTVIHHCLLLISCGPQCEQFAFFFCVVLKNKKNLWNQNTKITQQPRWNRHQEYTVFILACNVVLCGNVGKLHGICFRNGSIYCLVLINYDFLITAWIER